MAGTCRIFAGQLVTPKEIIQDAWVIIEEGIIVEIKKGSKLNLQTDDINMSHGYLLPGLIDIHSDAIEKEIQPRPKSRFPLETSMIELEKKLVAQGITTIYHSLSTQGKVSEQWTRQNDVVYKFIHEINEYMQKNRLIHHKVHLRYEISNIEAVSYIQNVIEKGLIHQISFMDHTPGQGQFWNVEERVQLLMKQNQWSKEEARQHINERMRLPKLQDEQLIRISNWAQDHQIPLATHDDDTIANLDKAEGWQAQIVEFPITLDVALEAKKRGRYVVMGAPNILLGRSHSQNLSAIEAIKHQSVDILCSDYYPPAMLQAVFLLKEQGYSLPDVCNMVTLNPAKAVGIDDQFGSIEVGKQADLICIGMRENRPTIEKVFVGGKNVLEVNYFQEVSNVLSS